MRLRNKPLHNRELHAPNIIAIIPSIHSWIENIIVVAVKLLNVDLCLRLPPNVDTYQILVKNRAMQYKTTNKNQQKSNQRLFEQAKDKFHFDSIDVFGISVQKSFIELKNI
jgi:hypothetical protein